MTLLPADIILTATPHGVFVGMNLSQFLQWRDEVESVVYCPGVSRQRMKICKFATE